MAQQGEQRQIAGDITRRDLLKLGVLAGSPLLLPLGTLLAEEDAAPDTGQEVELHIREVWLTNETHTDFGYTDLPSTVWQMHSEYLQCALKYCRETEGYPEDARFKWTVESLWTLERFLNEAAVEERKLFDEFVERGQIEVTAMPGNMTCLVGRHEWEKELDRLDHFYKTYCPTVAVQNDVNGLPWGMVESLWNRGIRRLAMGVNGMRTPVAVPSFFRWQGAKGPAELLVWNGLHYAQGYYYFHDEEWRRGPLPSAASIWYNRPDGNDVFSSAPDALRRSHEILLRKLSELAPEVRRQGRIMLPVTNLRTIDNDYPCRQLSDFVRAWNEQGLQPRLVFSTVGKFFDVMESQAMASATALRGDWSDWWGSGVASTPVELGLLQEARRRSTDLALARTLAGKKEDRLTRLEANLNHDLVFAAEHTWGSFESVRLPYSEKTRGCLLEKQAPFYRASESSRRIVSRILEQRDDYMPFSRTRTFKVSNPGSQMRSGWVNLPQSAFRFVANAARDCATGELFPLYDVQVENDAIAGVGGWCNDMVLRRFPIYNLAPGEIRKFELVQQEVNTCRQTRSQWFLPVLDTKTSVLKNVEYRPRGIRLFDEEGCGPGQILIERASDGERLRGRFFDHRLEEGDVVATLSEPGPANPCENPYVLEYKVIQTESLAKRIEQVWRFHNTIPRMELETTVWLGEIQEPVAASVAFPFAGQGMRCWYDSMGAATEVGRDQLPDSCAECHTIQGGVCFHGNDRKIALTSFSAPLGVFETIRRTGPQLPFIPANAHFFSLFLETFWPTNFSVVYPCKIILRYAIEVGLGQTPVVPIENDELWTWPCR
ncbi:MAG: hypothetical protein Q4G68_00665 [Planctomycetia bacterium]|nr:hypothetical protein [Planctomycetia bacterium]